MVIIAYLKLIRLPILVLIALIQYATRYCIIEPMLHISGYELLMPNREFLMLVVSTVLIAAGGYAINDYFDAKIDRVNKPKSVVLDRLIKRRVAMAMHAVLSGLGFLLSAYLSWKMGMWKMSSLFIFAIFSLWFYSTNLKHQLLVGNLVIAVMAGFVPLIVGLFEVPMQNAVHAELVAEMGFSIFNVPAFWIMGFALLLFGLTLVREITKDVIDIRGDKMFGCRTVPIVLGVTKTKTIIMTLYVLIMAALLWAYVNFLHQHSTVLVATFFAIELGLAIELVLIYLAKTKTQFLRSANLNNLVTLLVVLAMYLLKLSIEQNFELPQ